LPAATVEKGRQLFESKDCGTCHETKPGRSSDEAPNLAGYGSEEWLVRFVKNPRTFYGEHDKMPAFEKKLTESELKAVAVFLRSLQDPEAP
ncbi:MAG: cytochrome c, partial [Planctomycetota bacterium]